MPGLSQLKKFSSDLVSLGDEITIRASRGEKPVAVEIPKTVEDKNDSEDFVLGMPEIEAEQEVLPVDEDLSDLTGLVSPSTTSNDNKEDAAPAFAAPDLSSLLNPVAVTDEASGGDMPDLSMFMEEEAPQEEIVEEEPEEVSIADMGLDALLSGGGDFGEEPEPEPEPESEPLKEDDFEEIEDLDSSFEQEAEVVPEPAVEPVSQQNDGLSEIEKDLLNLDPDAVSVSSAPKTQSGEPTLDDLLGNLEFDEPSNDAGAASDFDSGVIEDLEDNVEPLEDIGSLDNTETFESAETIDDIGGFETPEVMDIPESAEPTESAELSDSLESTESFDTPDVLDDLGGFDVTDTMETSETPDETGSLESFDSIDDIGGFEAPEVMDIPESTESTDDFEATESFESTENFETTEGLDDIGEFDAPETSENNDSSMNFDMPEMPDDFDAGDASEVSFDNSVEDNSENSDIPAGLFDAGDIDLSAEDEIPDYGDDTNVDLDNFGDDSEEGTESNEPLEVFDAPEMEGLDFGIQDTDSQLETGNADSFELGSNDEFAMEGEFEIPGFSDVTTAKEDKPGKVSLATGKEKSKKSKFKNLPEPDFTDAAESEELPPNTLSDEQYKQFLKNLGEYPLNVRLAFEDFIVQNEFTDDAEFEVIEKILNKAPARSVASTLEKMLDTSIPVPRDFEHRTAEEYEAYKKSLSYQLKNKIIPGILVGIVLLFVGWGLVNFTTNCIINPLVANKLYKQGYALLEANEYPQAEMKYDQAAKKRINKKWFYKYARGYRAHKQYQRAAKMYQNILYYYNHEKDAGLEYADMELNDLANYAKAEEIVRREVLDYHINDPDGILKLGDVFLEWGTEKDPEKLEAAREQYATLLQLYPKSKQYDLYLSRMMRYFIRTDNLRQVITMQKHFEPKEKSLGSEDWTELSGYLLEKYYGPLAPSDEYLRYEIEGIRGLLIRAVKTGPNNPIALYNLAKYFIKTNETGSIESTLQNAIEKFNTVSSMKKRDVYKYIDSYRLLGEYYISTTDYLQAQEQFAEGISLFSTERDNAGFEGNAQIGKLYEDMGNIKYSIAGEYDDALFNYKYSVELENDNPSIRYRIGYIQYNKNNYEEALGSFMKAGDGNIKERNLLLAMGNTLALRNDDYAAQGYYNQLIDTLDEQLAERGVVFPQANSKDYDIVNTYLYAANNYGVTLYKLAKRTGNSGLNAQAIVQFSQSVRAWDALTRNQETMVRLPGSNLAEMNIQYITHPIPDFEPSVYTNISKTLLDNEHL